MAAVSDRVIDTVTLQFSANSKSFRDSVLQAKAHLEVGVFTARRRTTKRRGARDNRVCSALRVSGAHSAEDGKLLTYRQHSHQVKVQAPDTRVVGKGASRGGVKRVVKPAQIKIAALYCEVAVELITTKKLVANAAVVLTARIDSETPSRQPAVNSIVVKACPGAANVRADIRAGG